MFIQHTSASLTINENADPDVPADLESSFAAIAPEDFPYRHTCEGPDDMPAHVKAALLGSSVSVPIAEWQLVPGHLAGNLPVRAPAAAAAGGGSCSPSVGKSNVRKSRQQRRLGASSCELIANSRLGASLALPQLLRDL